MIIDIFPFFNELDVLELRLRHFDTLETRPDRVVVIESTQTFSGIDKPLFYLQNRERFAAWQDKITHLVIEPDGYLLSKDGHTVHVGELPNLVPDGIPSNWHNELQQRNAAILALNDADPSDLILIGDVDEIPHKIPQDLGPLQVLQYRQAFYYYTFNHRRGEPWIGTKVTTAGMLLNHSAEEIRQWGRLEAYPSSVVWGEVDGGWHFSHLYGSDVARYQTKLAAGSHQELNKPEYTDKDKILARVAAGRDLFDRGVPMVVTPIDATYPAVLQAHAADWWPYVVDDDD